MSELRLATRRSPLALIQARGVQDRLERVGIESVLVPTVTSGDQQRDVPLSQLGGQGVFALEIQRCVLQGDADVAVHSAKDLPSETPPELSLTCVPERRDVADVLVGRSLAGLGPGATVATGSPRRRALLLERRPDLRVVELRGNMATRLSAPGQNGVDAVVAASAALSRLEQSELVAERLDPAWFIPQVGQGALALEIRHDDGATRDILSPLNNDVAYTCLMAERAFLAELGTGCSIPAGAHAYVSEHGVLSMNAVMIAIDGSKSLRATLEGTDPRALGQSMARLLRDERGGGSLPGWGVVA